MEIALAGPLGGPFARAGGPRARAVLLSVVMRSASPRRPAPRRRPVQCRRRPGPRAAAAVAVAAAALVASGCASVDAPAVGSDGVARSTTRIAGSPVLGVERSPATACGPAAPLDPGAAPALDADRIVAVGTGALDTLCALGLQGRVVAVASPAGAAPLRYLGAWAGSAGSAGPADRVDVAAVSRARPDLILIDDAYSAQTATLAGTGARTAAVPTAGAWTGTVDATAAAVGRSSSARALVAQFRTAAATTGHDIAAGQTQASVARITDDGIETAGPSSFAGQVLADTGVPRPPAQRYGSPETRQVDPADLSPLEGDVLYIGFAGKDAGDADAGGATPAEQRGTRLMDSDAWQGLAVTENRTFTVDDGVWFRGRGLVAARGILDDLRDSLNRYG